MACSSVRLLQQELNLLYVQCVRFRAPSSGKDMQVQGRPTPHTAHVLQSRASSVPGGSSRQVHAAEASSVAQVQCLGTPTVPDHCVLSL